MISTSRLSFVLGNKFFPLWLVLLTGLSVFDFHMFTVDNPAFCSIFPCMNCTKYFTTVVYEFICTTWMGTVLWSKTYSINNHHFNWGMINIHAIGNIHIMINIHSI